MLMKIEEYIISALGGVDNPALQYGISPEKTYRTRY